MTPHPHKLEHVQIQLLQQERRRAVPCLFHGTLRPYDASRQKIQTPLLRTKDSWAAFCHLEVLKFTTAEKMDVKNLHIAHRLLGFSLLLKI